MATVFNLVIKKQKRINKIDKFTMSEMFKEKQVWQETYENLRSLVMNVQTKFNRISHIDPSD